MQKKRRRQKIPPPILSSDKSSSKRMPGFLSGSADRWTCGFTPVSQLGESTEQIFLGCVGSNPSAGEADQGGGEGVEEKRRRRKPVEEKNNNNNNRIERRNSRFVYNLLTAPRTVSNTCAQVAWEQSCVNHVQHIERFITCNVSCYVPHGTKGQLSY